MEHSITDRSAELDKLFHALRKTQSMLGHPKKNKRAYNYNYCDLVDVIDYCKPALDECKLVIIQRPSVSIDSKAVTVRTMLAHDSGQFIESALTMGLPNDKPQTVGAVVTYARRYGYSAMVGVSSEEDNDGEGVQDKQPKPKPPIKTIDKKTINPDQADELLTMAMKVGIEKHLMRAVKEEFQCKGLMFLSVVEYELLKSRIQRFISQKETAGETPNET